MGAAGIWSIACDDKHIFITHSGTHEVSVIDHPAMLAKFESYKDKSRLDYDLNFLYGLRERVTLQGNGPRNFIFSGDKLIIPTYFADILNTVDINTLEVTATDMNPGVRKRRRTRARNTLTTQIIAIKAGRVVTVAIRGMPVRTG